MARNPNPRQPNEHTLYLGKSGSGKSQALKQNGAIPKRGRAVCCGIAATTTTRAQPITATGMPILTQSGALWRLAGAFVWAGTATAARKPLVVGGGGMGSAGRQQANLCCD